MKLLLKKQVADIKNEEARKEVQQGSMLAQRIDQLRQTNAQEEAKLKATREVMTTAIRSEVDELHEEIKRSRKEILDIEKKRIELLKPLDDEWERVKKAKKKVQAQLKLIDEERADNHLALNQLQERIDIVDDNISQAREFRDNGEKLYRKRTLQLQEVERLTEQLQQDIENFVTSRNEAERLLANRETRLEMREKELIIKQNNLRQRENELNLAYVRSRRQ